MTFLLLFQDETNIKHIYLYYHKASVGSRGFLALFLTPVKRAVVVVLDSVKTNQMPNLIALYKTERITKYEQPFLLFCFC